MNKKNLFSSLSAIILVSFAFSSCSSSSAPEEENAVGTDAVLETRIAFVEVDTLMSQYNFCKDYSLVLQKKGNNIQNTLTQKQDQLEAAAANFSEKLQQNAYTRDQAESIQAQLQKQQNDLQVLSQRLTTEFQTETDKYNNALRDSIQHFLAVYNKDKKYSLILSRAGDNMLYADEALDITKDVVDGLNKIYKSAPEFKEKK